MSLVLNNRALVLQQIYPLVSVLGLCQLPSSGPGCSKLTMLLGKVSLKFQMHFSHFSTKNISGFGYKVVKY